MVYTDFAEPRVSCGRLLPWRPSSRRDTGWIRGRESPARKPEKCAPLPAHFPPRPNAWKARRVRRARRFRQTFSRASLWGSQSVIRVLAAFWGNHILLAGLRSHFAAAFLGGGNSACRMSAARVETAGEDLPESKRKAKSGPHYSRLADYTHLRNPSIYPWALWFWEVCLWGFCHLRDKAIVTLMDKLTVFEMWTFIIVVFSAKGIMYKGRFDYGWEQEMYY